MDFLLLIGVASMAALSSVVLSEKAVCLLPLDAGKCRSRGWGRGRGRGARKIEWGYDADMKECRQFLYSGCGGNENRYRSENECQTDCMNENPCGLALDAGTCSGSYRVYGYSASQGQCVEYSYGGCGGNENRFTNKPLCEKTCITVPARCLQPKAARGPCKAQRRKFTYDPKLRKCVPFIFGGCRGNANRFPTLERCTFVCVTEPAALQETNIGML